jgi:hypothetical protein
VTDGFLLNMAEVSATLIGLFFVGIFFYIESGLRRLETCARWSSHTFEPVRGSR